MDKKSIIAQILNKKVIRDYTYTILFLFLSSFFAFFAIRPALKIAFSLQKEAVELRVANSNYEKDISKVVQLQALMEGVRGQSHLVDEAIPESPYVAQLVDQINTLAAQRNMRLDRMEVSPVSLGEESGDAIASVDLSFKTSGEYGQVMGIFDELLNQRRLKSVSKFVVSKDDKVSTTSSQLNVEVGLEGYYL